MKKIRVILCLVLLITLSTFALTSCGFFNKYFGDRTPDPVKLTAPTVTVSENGLATWQSVTNAVGYVYKINGGDEVTTTSTAVQLTDGQSIVVKAIGNGTEYTDSDYSAAVTYTAPSTPTPDPVKLTAPTVTVSENGLVTWQSVANAVGYVYKINGGDEVTTTSTTVQLTDGQSIVVKAIGNGTEYTDSDYSAAVTYTAPSTPTPDPVKLTAPTVTVSENGLAAWQAVTNAVGYVYKINGGDEVTTTSTTVQLTDGQSIVVKAIGNGTEYTDSDYSAAVTYTAPFVGDDYELPPQDFEKDDASGDNGSGDDYMSDKNYKYVVVIGVDGAGAFFQNTDTPNIDAIFENGAITYDCLTANPTISAQCWGSLLHGVVPSVHGLTNSIAGSTPYPTDSKFPSFFRVIRENNTNALLASFSHWNAINVGIIEDGIDVHKVGGLSDAALTAEILKYLADNIPTAMFVQFDEADGAGHSSGYGTATQLAKITEIDGYIGQIYDAYKALGILDDTLFIVTSDHGGSGTSHGGLTDAEKYVMFAAAGKTVENGEIQDIEIRDTAAIVLHALGYTAPETWTARVPSGLFEGVTAGERPVYVDKDSDRYHESEPTPTEDSEGYVTNYIKNHSLTTYLKFDGDITDACGGNITKTGNLYFVDGYFGNGVALDDGYVSINDYAPGTSSFTISLWISLESITTDPLIFSNKDWETGKNVGLALSPRNGKYLRLNFGDGTNRIDCDVDLPSDYSEGWMHVIAVIDRESNKLSLCCDFGTLVSVDIPESLQNVSLTTAFSALNIGQDGTGVYEYSMPATIDEFMIFEGVFGREDISALAEYYGRGVSSSVDFRDNEPAATPAKDSNGYITNYITDKELATYLTFDGNVNDSTEQSTVTANGNVSYEDGFFGQGINLSSGYVSIANITPGTESFSVAFWMKTDGVTGDPILVSNKDWSVGKNAGFAISLRDTNDLRVDLADGTNRSKGDPALPEDYLQGWVYVIVVYDRENSEIRVSYDFGEFTVYEISESLANVSADGCTNAINIGQDGTGSYDDSLTATLDEFMLFNGALDSDDIQSLAEYFGI